MIEIFETKSKSVFKKEIDKIILDNPKIETTITKKRDYILNNYKPIKMMLKSHIGFSMESHISHYVSSKFASPPKGYSSLNINKYFRLNDYSNNNINLINLYINLKIIKKK